MAAPSTTPADAEARPCTARLHTNGRYAVGKCTCEVGRAERSRYTHLYRAGQRRPIHQDATGGRRRMQGLMAQGWNCPTIAAAAGLTGQWASDVLSRAASSRKAISPQTAAAIERAAAVLGDEVGPSTHARRRAEARGYVPLWAWMPGTIDDPLAEPWMDEVAIERVVRAGRYALPEGPALAAALSPAELRYALTRLSSLRVSDKVIGANLRVSSKRVGAFRTAAGIPRVTWEEQRAA